MLDKPTSHTAIRTLQAAGISWEDAYAVRRISMTLHRWNELECSGEVERDETTGKTFAVYNMDGPGPLKRYRIPDREKGAQRRLLAILARYPLLQPYEQGDPRGAALYIIPRKSLDDGRDVHSCYSSVGVAVYR